MKNSKPTLPNFEVSSDKGDYAVLKVSMDLTEKGFIILKPLVNEHTRFDIVAYKDNKFYKIQVKYRNNGMLDKATSSLNRKGNVKKYYQKDDFDYYAVYLSEINQIIYPSITFAGSKIATKLPNSATPFYWWKDFLSLTDKAEKKTFKDFGYKLVGLGSKADKPNKRKTVRPSKQILLKLLWELPTTQIATQFNVSDKAISKWAKRYDIAKPPRGYWTQLQYKTTEEKEVYKKEVMKKLGITI